MLLLLPDNLPEGELSWRNGAYTCSCTL